MTRFLAICLVAITSFLIPSVANAERITVSSDTGDNLIDACAGMPDRRIISTTSGNYNGCCSKALGYCVLCPTVGQCYKFSHARSLNKFLKDSARDNNKVIEEKPTRPSGIIKKSAPNTNKIVK